MTINNKEKERIKLENTHRVIKDSLTSLWNEDSIANLMKLRKVKKSAHVWFFCELRYFAADMTMTARDSYK